LPGLPAGVKFDPTDQEVLEHLEGKVRDDAKKLHPLIDEFIRTIDGENGICYTHPEKLPGDSMLHVQSSINRLQIETIVTNFPSSNDLLVMLIENYINTLKKQFNHILIRWKLSYRKRKCS